jgi:hypothetical protein
MGVAMFLKGGHFIKNFKKCFCVADFHGKFLKIFPKKRGSFSFPTPPLADAHGLNITQQNKKPS